ncbi:farnesol dehydrogenase-like [Sipha flava]|uniref:Dehydrogenase/reductase SDR family member 11 n=1 Tax=Sipha flava TaxID=143950 RepID=A0A2S2QP60_9HEMI|nr:farnesol dehydrogenase-like [Sipha flava]XP_025412801.1 farnesol dehydrogenase-like [Sipha flava]XP_025412802.1 farnesol dehydrogenase-like [Sipha flava]
MEQWRGRNAIVTGAGSGIGAATALELLKHGVNVIGLDVQSAKLVSLENSIKNDVAITDTPKRDQRGIFYPKVCDITNERAVQDVFVWVDDALGGVSVLVNNAGIIIRTSLLDGTLKDWTRFMDINVLAQCVCSREAYRSMTKNKINGHIVQINSICGHSKTPYFAHKMYNATKTAITVLCEGLRHELSLVDSKIKISSISPGSVDTDIFKTAQFRPSSQVVSSRPALKPNDVAAAIITVLDTPPHVEIAELTIIPNGSTIQSYRTPLPVNLSEK